MRILRDRRFRRTFAVVALAMLIALAVAGVLRAARAAGREHGHAHAAIDTPPATSYTPRAARDTP